MQAGSASDLYACSSTASAGWQLHVPDACSCRVQAADLECRHQGTSVWKVGHVHFHSMAGCMAEAAALRMLPAP